MAIEVSEVTEAVLMRKCGNLYVSIMLESLVTTIMGCVFTYLLLLITNKNRLRTPGKAARTFIYSQITNFISDVYEEVSHWADMKELPLERRFALCRKCNQAVCSFSIFIGVLTIERWLHINNINGFRYLGYAVTCPPMQTQLVILIAPAVPCYRLTCKFTYLATTVMLLAGYISSVMQGEVWEGNLQTFIDTWVWEDLRLTTKGYMAVVATGVLAYLTFLQIPLLAFLYIVKGGVKAGLPHGYLRLLTIVAVTWVAFPAWWALSFEGFSIIEDTKMNAVGFALLNVISKGGFTLEMLSIVKWHRREKKRQECVQQGRRPSADKTGLFGVETQSVARPEAPNAAQNPAIERKDRRSETWVVRLLRPYDIDMKPSEEWIGLQHTFRAFLVGNGVTPSAWNSMSAEQHAQMREEYANTFNMVVATDSVCANEENAGKNKETSRDRTVEVKSKVVPPVKDAPRSREDGPLASSKGGVAFDLDTDRESIAQSNGEPPNIRTGQIVTTVHGLKGRAMKLLGQQVQIAVPGNRTEVVNSEELTMLKIVFLGARDLPPGDRHGQSGIRCSGLIDGKPSSEVHTPLLPNTSGPRLSWDLEIDVFGYSPGDVVVLRLWSQDGRSSSDSLLGEAKVPSTEISDIGYEGELRLVSQEGDDLLTSLKIMIIGFNLPEDAGTGNLRPVSNGWPKISQVSRATCHV